MSLEGDFEQNMRQLMKLLKKIMTQYPVHGKSPEEMMKAFQNTKEKGRDVNIFFLNLAPLSPEEFEELEDIFEEGLMSEHSRSGEMRCELSTEDREFLKRHGIRF